MRNSRCVLPVWAVLVLPVLFWGILFSGAVNAQESECTYDRNAPSVENARISLKSLDYKCAEAELNDFLGRSTLSLEEKADALVLLGSVYYAMKERREKVLDQLVAAFRLYRSWRGELDITSSEFMDLMAEAKRIADTPQPAAQPAVKPSTSEECPSAKLAWVGTGIFAAASGLLVVTSLQASSKWDDYESNLNHPADQYDSYKSASRLRNIVGAATIAAGVATGYLWIKYLSDKGDCAKSGPAGSDHAGIGLQTTPCGAVLTYRF